MHARRGAALSALASAGALAVFELVRLLAPQSGVNGPAWSGRASSGAQSTAQS